MCYVTGSEEQEGIQKLMGGDEMYYYTKNVKVCSSY